MTQFELTTAWYPLVAFAVLLFVMSVLLFLRWFSVDLNLERWYPTKNPRSKRQPPTFQLIGAGEASAPPTVDPKPSQVKLRLGRDRGSPGADTFDVEEARSIGVEPTDESRQAPLRSLRRFIAGLGRQRKSTEPKSHSRTGLGINLSRFRQAGPPDFFGRDYLSTLPGPVVGAGIVPGHISEMDEGLRYH